MVSLDTIVERGVYFLFGEPDFFHLSVSVAEGLKALGIPIYANRNYWPLNLEESEYLFECDATVQPQDCPICVSELQITSQHQNTSIFAQLANLPDDTISIVLDAYDSEYRSPEIEQVNYVLRPHTCTGLTYPEHYRPWAFGLSDRIRIATENDISFQQRDRTVLAAFRSSLFQGVRLALHFSFLPHLQPHFKIDDNLILTVDDDRVNVDPFHALHRQLVGFRHIRYWFDRLKKTQFCCCYGGNFDDANLYRFCTPSPQLQPTIARWDSWRLWESFAAGCATIHVDLEKYGLCLPVMPENWTHYIGIDLENPKATADRILDEPELTAKIARQGQQWALDNYSSISVACRFLDIALGEELGTTHSFLQTIAQTSRSQC